MVKKIQKYFYWAIFTLVFGAIFLLGFLKSGDLPRFYVTADSHTEVISTYNAQDGNYYVFLPAYAQLEDVIVDVPYFQSVFLDGIRLENGMNCSRFQLETPYELQYKRTTATLWFYRSDNVATMYIHTRSGNLESFRNDKEHEEAALVSVYTSDGKAESTQLYSTLKGRGNGTWGLDKRPYSVTFSQDTDLLHMGSSKNWILLANAYDETNLNNKLALDLAKEVGFSWTPDCAFVDVYLNGQYNGLYLLTEKVEVGINRLEIDTDSGDFLCKVDLMERMETLRNPFITHTGRVIEVTAPRVLPQYRKEEAEALVNQMEQHILSGNELDTSAFDLDSWVRRYLIDEIFGNIDSDLASSYFYVSGGKFFAGPVWDYDIALGNNTRNQNPHAFIAKNAAKSGTHLSPYYAALYQNPVFYRRMTEIYEAEFLPAMEQLLAGGIRELDQSIRTAASLNSLRWGAMYETNRSEQFSPVQTTGDLTGYLQERIAFLNRAWLEGETFHTLQFELVPGNPYWNISLEPGTIPQTVLPDLGQHTWFYADTGLPFDPSQGVTRDAVLLLPQSAEVPAPEENLTWQQEQKEMNAPVYAVCTLSIALLLGLFAVFIVLDIRQRHAERRPTHDRSKISS